MVGGPVAATGEPTTTRNGSRRGHRGPFIIVGALVELPGDYPCGRGHGCGHRDPRLPLGSLCCDCRDTGHPKDSLLQLSGEGGSGMAGLSSLLLKLLQALMGQTPTCTNAKQPGKESNCQFHCADIPALCAALWFVKFSLL